MLHLLAGELALKQRDPARALEEYRKALALSNSPEVAKRTARVALYLGRDEVARDAVERWLALAPEAPEAHRYMGLLELRAGNVDAAAEQFRAVVAATEEPREAFDALVAMLRQEEDAGPVLEVVGQLVESFPEQPAAHLALAQLALAAGDHPLVLEATDRALALQPGWRDAYLLRAEAQRSRGDDAAALESLREALESAPQDHELRLHYARTLLDAGFPEQALAQFEQLVTARPGDVRARYAAGLLALEAGELERAREHFLQLVNLGERSDDAYYYLGRIAEAEQDLPGALRWYNRVEQGDYLERARLRVPVLLAEEGQLAEARAALAELRGAMPDLAVDTYLLEARILNQAGQPQQARAMVEQGLNEFPQHPDLLYQRALMAAAAGNVARAEADLRQVLEQNPDNVLALNALGYTLVDMTDRVQEGFELIQRAYEGSSEDPAIVDSMGWAHYRLGNLEQALEYLSRAYALHEDDEIGAHLGEVLWQLGRREEARALWREALQREPESAILRRTMERLMQ